MVPSGSKGAREAGPHKKHSVQSSISRKAIWAQIQNASHCSFTGLCLRMTSVLEMAPREQHLRYLLQLLMASSSVFLDLSCLEKSFPVQIRRRGSSFSGEWSVTVGVVEALESDQPLSQDPRSTSSEVCGNSHQPSELSLSNCEMYKVKPTS